MFVFYDCPFPHVYFAKNAAYFPFNSWLSFQRLCRLLWALVLSEAMRSAGSTLGRGREGPSKLWLGPKFSRTLGTFHIMVRYCIKTAKGIHCGELILRKVSKFYATRCQILRLKCTKFDFRWGYAPDSSGGAYSAPLRPLAVFKGAYF